MRRSALLFAIAGSLSAGHAVGIAGDNPLLCDQPSGAAASLLQRAATPKAAAPSPGKSEALAEASLEGALREHERLKAEAEEAAAFKARARRERDAALAEVHRARHAQARARAEASRLRAEDMELRRRSDGLARRTWSATEGESGEGSEHKSGHTSKLRRWSYYITGGFLAAGLLYKAAMWYKMFIELISHVEGEGDMDIRITKNRFCCGLSRTGVRNIFLVFAIAAAGMVGLFKAHIIQKFAAPIAMIAFVILVLVSCLQVIIQDHWQKLMSSLLDFLGLVKRLEHAFSGQISAIVDSPIMHKARGPAR